MIIQCECGQFKAELTGFPKNSPGRLVCYCDDCQAYLHYLGRTDLLDSAGGTEVIPSYPNEFKFLEGRENLKCTRLSPNGMYRWSTACCNTPIANTQPKFPWIGIIYRAFTSANPDYLKQNFGDIRSRIKGRDASHTPPEGTSPNISLKDIKVVFPFLLRGFLTGRSKNSPFFNADGTTPITKPYILTKEERRNLKEQHLANRSNMR